jgi:hypothetical protein
VTNTTSRTRKPTRTSFGSVRRLPSGRYQARFTDAREERHTAPMTFASKREAEDWLATIRADMVRGVWRAPGLGAVSLADYTASLLAVRVDLAPKTRQLYEELARLWINATHELPPGRGGAVRTINLGEMELGPRGSGGLPGGAKLPEPEAPPPHPQRSRSGVRCLHLMLAGCPRASSSRGPRIRADDRHRHEGNESMFRPSGSVSATTASPRAVRRMHAR